jgi:hypothetical protein
VVRGYGCRSNVINSFCYTLRYWVMILRFPIMRCYCCYSFTIANWIFPVEPTAYWIVVNLNCCQKNKRLSSNICSRRSLCMWIIISSRKTEDWQSISRTWTIAAKQTNVNYVTAQSCTNKSAGQLVILSAYRFHSDTATTDIDHGRDQTINAVHSTPPKLSRILYFENSIIQKIE